MDLDLAARAFMVVGEGAAARIAWDLAARI
jgi:hypothetical protein